MTNIELYNYRVIKKTRKSTACITILTNYF